MSNASKHTPEPSSNLTGQRELGLPKTGKDRELAHFERYQYSPPLNPADSVTLQLRKTFVRNGITHLVPSKCDRSMEKVPTACARMGGIASKANALGKAKGHADRGTVIWNVETQVGVQKL